MSILTFAFWQQKVEAYDFYCGTYNSGLNAYLMTETVRYREAQDYAWIDCRVKAVQDSLVIYLDYNFEISSGGTISFTNSQGFSGRFGGVLYRKGVIYPVEEKIFNVAYKYVK